MFSGKIYAPETNFIAGHDGREKSQLWELLVKIEKIDKEKTPLVMTSHCHIVTHMATVVKMPVVNTSIHQMKKTLQVIASFH